MTDPVQPAGLDDIAGGRPVLVLAPHPDDESLGCGALLAAAFAGPGAHVVCMTDGAGSHPNSRLWPRPRLVALRAAELDEAVTALGGGPGDVTRLGLPDTALPSEGPQAEAAARQIAALAARLGAATLIATAPTDPHCDHLATARIAARAARAGGLRLLHYPVWSDWHDPSYRSRLPHRVEHRFATGPARAAKAAAIAAHRSQLGQVIDDDPEGFVLPAAFVARFCDRDEVYFEGVTEAASWAA